MSDILNISIDPNSNTVTYELDGNRMKNPTEQLTKVYSATDNAHLWCAIHDLLWFYRNEVEG